ncbi:hypothetical protein KO507_14330 [Gilvimarinus agarilyticus]|uniref:hypothetical protein n=1 Tax=Gilvimarinus sp. 2_MG-2023 TaxID=3062666 RepID=UPI001C09042C|nr:hypothetical protein [Gilvimarinus sp. 2_MG-2023]MBU2886943.1 hypothetical protein [Gilvimarinus agarilyticus]MDO6571603.1 hypothetical protein [Gilvimarinus sp. 2_MG-2023]
MKYLWASLALYASVLSPLSLADTAGWILIDDFEAPNALVHWSKADTKNDTEPRIDNPQVTERRTEAGPGEENAYLLKKPAAEGIVGNRKALTYKALPREVKLGETFTFYSRIQVESFPNNHAFGVSNMGAEGIEKNDYNAFEPTLRVTDKTESSGLVNTGALMVKVDGGYANVINPTTGAEAKPLEPGLWYEIWYVVNNAPRALGGQRYDVFVRGGEFAQRMQVYRQADFRMQREQPLTHFLMNCNTGPHRAPYGNGGLLYDDLYMSQGVNLLTPKLNSN